MKLNIFNFKMKLCCHKLGRPCIYSVNYQSISCNSLSIGTFPYSIKYLNYIHLKTLRNRCVPQDNKAAAALLAELALSVYSMIE